MKPPKDAEVFHTPAGQYWMDKEGIVRAVMNGGSYSSMTERQATFREFISRVGSGKRCIIVDVTNASPLSRDMQVSNLEFFPRLFSAIAFISTSAYGRMLGHVFFGMQPNALPNKVFSTEEEALSWIREYKP